MLINLQFRKDSPRSESPLETEISSITSIQRVKILLFKRLLLVPWVTIPEEGLRYKMILRFAPNCIKEILNGFPATSSSSGSGAWILRADVASNFGYVSLIVLFLL